MRCGKSQITTATVSAAQHKRKKLKTQLSKHDTTEMRKTTEGLKEEGERLQEKEHGSPK